MTITSQGAIEDALYLLERSFPEVPGHFRVAALRGSLLRGDSLSTAVEVASVRIRAACDPTPQVPSDCWAI